MTRWWWIRHGPTHQKTFCGWRDVPADLSNTDHIDWLNLTLPRDAILVSSDLIRAVATADTLTQNHPRLPHSPAIREFDFGVWDGMSFQEVSARDQELSRQYWEQPGNVAAPGGESWNDAARRTTQFVDEMNAIYTGRDIIAVAHFGTILTQVQRAGGMDAYKALSYEIDNMSVTEMVWDGENWHLGAINQMP